MRHALLSACHAGSLTVSAVRAEPVANDGFGDRRAVAREPVAARSRSQAKLWR